MNLLLGLIIIFASLSLYLWLLVGLYWIPDSGETIREGNL